jgi:MFS family permease
MEMTHRSIARFIRHWRRAIAYGIRSAAFGYGSTIAAVIVAILFVGGRFQAPSWAIPIVSAAIAIIAVFVLHVFIGFYRAWKMLSPFKVDIVSGILDTEYPKAQFEPQRIAIRVKNMSYMPRHDCVIRIMNMDGIDNRNHIFPRFVESLTVDSGETKLVSLMFRAFRSTPYGNYTGITLAGPVSPAYGDNIVRPMSTSNYTVTVRIDIPDTAAAIFRLNVLTDETSLRAERISAPPTT